MSPGGPGEPQTARGLRGLRGRGQFKEVSAGARVRRREDLMGFLLLVGVFVHQGPRNSSVVLQLEGGGRGRGWEAANGEQTLTTARGGGEEEYQPPGGCWRSGAVLLVALQAAGFRGCEIGLAVSSRAGKC